MTYLTYLTLLYRQKAVTQLRDLFYLTLSMKNIDCISVYIRASSNRAVIHASTEHDFGFSISSFDST